MKGYRVNTQTFNVQRWAFDDVGNASHFTLLAPTLRLRWQRSTPHAHTPLRPYADTFSLIADVLLPAISQMNPSLRLFGHLHAVRYHHQCRQPFIDNPS